MLHLLLAFAWIFQTTQPAPIVKPSRPVEVSFQEADWRRISDPRLFLKPLQHVPFPRVKDWKSVKITLQRLACYGNCPWYRVEVHGDGSVLYEGKSHVAVTGHHRGLVPQENVLELVRVFEQTDYYSLLDQHSPCPIDTERQVTSIEIDGRSKQVTSCVAGEIGTPAAVSDLELAIDRLSDSARWTRGNAKTQGALEAEHWDFKSAEAAATLARVAEYGNADGVRGLVSKGVAVNGKNDHGNTTLVQAAIRADMAMLRTLLNAGAAANRRDLAHAVVSAAHSGKIEALRLLLSRGGYLGSRDKDGRAVLMAAATSGSPAMMHEILKSHPDVNARVSCHHCERAGRTALMELAAYDFWVAPSQDVLEVAQLLIRSGADVNARDQHGNTALIFCVRHSHKLALPLIQAGADVNAHNDQGGTALSNAYDDNLKQLLTQHGAVNK